MITLINYLPNLPQSVEVAERCKESCEKYDIEAYLFPAIWRDEVDQYLSLLPLKVGKIKENYSNKNAVIANFLTNYEMWMYSLLLDETLLILEHDSVLTGPIPDIEWPPITNVGKPSFGAYGTKDKEGLYKPFSKPGYFPGAHGYIITPKGAQKLLDSAREHGIVELDLFFNPSRLPLKEYWPWFVEAHDSFSTIQKEEGCKAKHNWGKEYEVI